MKIPFKYSIRNFKKRKLTTTITVSGIALVVFVFAAVLMMANGIRKTLVATGSVENVIITRKSATSELTSIIGGETQKVIETLPFIAKDNNNKLLITKEPVAIINIEKKTGGLSNVTVRGVSLPAMIIRNQIKITQGRMFETGKKEVVVGSSINKNFQGTEIGQKIKFANGIWTIVGIMDANGSAFESELWGDSEQILSAFNRETAVSTVTLKLDNKDNFEQFQRRFETDRRLKEFTPKIEREFFAEQSEFMSVFISVLGIFITVIFSIGAVIGAAITMYAAVANRTIEIGTLRALGFTRFSIMVAFLSEALIISLGGGAIGLFLASFLQFFSISTLNYQTFSEISFSFALSPEVVVQTLIFALIMGIIGGFAPSFRASRLKIVDALRGN